jgi:hypothetical protein
MKLGLRPSKRSNRSHCLPMYPVGMATKAADTDGRLPDDETVRRYREALLDGRAPAAHGSAEERVSRAREAMSGLRLGVPVTPSLYR